MKIHVDLKERSYPIWIEAGALNHIEEIIDTSRHYAIIADDGIPEVWVETVHSQCPHSFVLRFAQGEGAKCFEVYQDLLSRCIDHGLTRKDAILAIGGGVTGDLAGFVAATYMRGIDFYNIPTSLLAQVDSSVGGKVAIDAGSYKNIVGAFHQPRGVLIDPDVLQTLPQRQLHNGLAEALKTGLIQDEKLVDLFEEETLDIPQIITRSIEVKRRVVEQDEKEGGLRQILNFGHTIGHAIESAYGLEAYLHGECVAMGMLFFIEDEALKQRVLKIYQRLQLPAVPDYDVAAVMNYIRHDKKSGSDSVNVIKVAKAGSFTITPMTFAEIEAVLKRGPYAK